MKPELHEANRLSWNAATLAHNSHKGDQAAFFRDGGSTLFPEEAGLLGEVKGLSVLHLHLSGGQKPMRQFLSQYSSFTWSRPPAFPLTLT